MLLNCILGGICSQGLLCLTYSDGRMFELHIIMLKPWFFIVKIHLDWQCKHNCGAFVSCFGLKACNLKTLVNALKLLIIQLLIQPLFRQEKVTIRACSVVFLAKLWLTFSYTHSYLGAVQCNHMHCSRSASFSTRDYAGKKDKWYGKILLETPWMF